MRDIGELKELVFEANMDLIREGLVFHTFGNVSGIDRSRGLVAIKPSGVPYDDLMPDDIVVVDMEGRVLEGSRPSSDTRTHLVLYRNVPCIGGIAHTHSSYATSWAQAHRSIPCLGTTHADSLPGSVPCTRSLGDSEIGGDYETATGNVIVELFDTLSPADTEMALVASHGPFTWGATPEKAVLNSLLLEEIAKTAFRTLLLNPSAMPIGKALHNRHFSRKHGVDAYYGQD